MLVVKVTVSPGCADVVDIVRVLCWLRATTVSATAVSAAAACGARSTAAVKIAAIGANQRSKGFLIIGSLFRCARPWACRGVRLTGRVLGYSVLGCGRGWRGGQVQLMIREVTAVHLRVAVSLAGLESVGLLAVRVAVTV